MNSNNHTFQFPQFNLNQTFSHLQHHCSSFLHSFFNPNPSQLHSPLFNLQNHTKHFIYQFSQIPVSSSKNPLWARIPNDHKTLIQPLPHSKTATPTEIIEERLAGVPVYALSNPNEEFVLVTGASTGKSVGFLCFKKGDAELLLHQMRSMDPGMRKTGSKVVPLALGKVFQLKVDGVAFRFIPESSQIKNAIKERKKAGLSDDSFSGVPVFQSRSLVLKSQNNSYRPVFFRKEDLEKSLMRASTEQKKLNPALKQGDIQVAVFEEILKSMKESATSTWADVVFIPPGFDISTDPADLQ